MGQLQRATQAVVSGLYDFLSASDVTMKTLFLLLGVHLAVSCAAAEDVQDAEPVVNGRPMSYWLRTWAERTSEYSQRAEAEKAFKQAGTNVIPYLLSQLTAADGPLARENPNDPDSVEEVRQALNLEDGAQAALRIMGSCVTSAIPQLITLLSSTNHRAVYAAAWILSDLGPQGTDVLVRAFSSTNKHAREVVPHVLRHMARQASRTNLWPHFSVLFSSLDTLPMEKAFDISAAIVDSVVSEFIGGLQSTNKDTRYVCITVLERMGASAQGAIPELPRLTKDPSPSVRRAAAEALRRLQQSDTWVPDYSVFDSLLNTNRNDRSEP